VGVMVAFGAAAAVISTSPRWAFGAVAVTGLICAVILLKHWWPFNHPDTPPTDRGENETERRELRGLAQALRTELETCRYRLESARNDRHGWTSDKRLPSEQYSAWARSAITADETNVNRALEGFYVWADQTNHAMCDRETVEVAGVTQTFSISMLDLSDDDISEMGEGLSRIKNAQEHLGQLIERLAPVPGAKPTSKVGDDR